MANSTDGVNIVPKDSTIVVAIVVPAVVVIVLVILIVTAFIVPRFCSSRSDFATLKARRMIERREEINTAIKTQHFYDWLAAQKEKHGTEKHGVDPVCAICLEDFDPDTEIRGLRCSHAFHVRCLDEWFSRFNEFCPLCHRIIIPGKKVASMKMVGRPDPIPVAFMA